MLKLYVALMISPLKKAENTRLDCNFRYSILREGKPKNYHGEFSPSVITDFYRQNY